jgi:hypothetical protein
MDDNLSYVLSFFAVLLFFAVVIGLPIFLIRLLIKRKKKKNNPLKKGVFKLTEDEKKQGIIGFSIAGITYRDKGLVYSELATLELGDEFTLDPEPENKYDEYAIKVLSNYHTHFGYVPLYLTYKFRDHNDKHIYHKCVVSGIQRGIYIDVFIKCYPISTLK